MRENQIYDPISNRVNFNNRKVSEYKHNKKITLPGPMPTDKEVEGEQRRKLYLQAFEDYKKEIKGGKQASKSMNSRSTRNPKNLRQIENLTLEENKAIRSLKRRIKEGELMVTMTDKSGRMAVVTREQYLQSGSCHTSKDREVTWREIKQLQTNLNNHSWWVAEIVYCSIICYRLQIMIRSKYR